MQPIEEGEEQLKEVNNILAILQKLSKDQFNAELAAMPKHIREIFSWIFFIPNDKLALQMNILQQLIDYQSDKTNYTQIKDSIKSLNLNHLDLIESRLKNTPVSLFQQYTTELKTRTANLRSSSPIVTYQTTSSQLSPTVLPTNPPFATLKPTASTPQPSTGALPQLFPLNTNIRPAYFAESTFAPINNNENSNNTQGSPPINTMKYSNDPSHPPLNASVSSLASEGDAASYMYNSDAEEPQDYPSSPTRYITDPKRTSNINAASDGYHDSRNSNPAPVSNPINVSTVSLTMTTDSLSSSGYSNNGYNLSPPPMSSSGHIKFTHFVDAVYKFCSDTEKFSGDIKLNGYKWSEHKDSQGNTVTAILVSIPEAEKSWGKGEGEVHSEFESYGFFYENVDSIKRMRKYWLEIGNVGEVTNLRRSSSMVQPKSMLVKMTLKEVNDAWLNHVLKNIDGKEQIKEMLMKLLSSDDLRQDEAKIFTGSRKIRLKNFIEYQKQAAPQTPNILACWYNISLILESYAVNGELTLTEFLRFLNQFGSWNMLLSVIESLFDSTTGVSHAYFGKISVKEVWNILRNKPPGSFLLRDPTSDGNILTASFNTSQGQLEHAKIWRSSANLYFIPEEKNAKVKKFATISECIKAFPEFKEPIRTTKQWLPVVMTSPRPINNSSPVQQELRKSTGSSASSMLNFDSPRVGGVTMPEHSYQNLDGDSNVNKMKQSSAKVGANPVANNKPDPVLDFVRDALGTEGLKDTTMVNEIVPSLLAQYHQHAGLPKPTSTDVNDLMAKIKYLALSSSKNSNTSEVKHSDSISFAVPALNLSFGSVQEASMVSPHGNISYNNSANNNAPKSGKKIERKVVVDGYYEGDEL